MATTFKLISSYTLSASQQTVTFSSIPNTYTDLYLYVSGRSTAPQGIGNIVVLPTINGVNTNFAQKRLYGGSTTGTDGYTLNNGTTWGPQLPATSTTANVFSNFFVYLANYASSTTAKPIYIDSAALSPSTTDWETDLIAQYWGNTNAITSIGLSPTGGNWTADSTFYLYGISKS